MRGHLTGLLPVGFRRWLRATRLAYRRQLVRMTSIDFGDLRRLEPMSRMFGTDRGLPIDRYYIERFLGAHATDVRGRVLEFGNDTYIRRFGGNRVTQADVLHYVPGNPKATIVADVTKVDDTLVEIFDCIICTQTLQMIFDVRAALKGLNRMLKPGGVLLATAHGTSRICRREGVDDWGEYWRFTSQSLEHLVAEAFGQKNLQVTAHGNVLAAISFLHGLATEELAQEELDTVDPNFEVLISVRAVKGT
jgi:SAM-dependent methyltransferase